MPFLRSCAALVVLAVGLAACAPPASLVPSDLSSGSLLDFPRVGAISVDSLARVHQDQDGVFLSHVVTLEHNFGAPLGGTPQWTYVTTVQRQYVVLDPDEERLTTLAVPTGPGDHLAGLFARITSPEGQVRTQNETDAVRTPVGDGASYKLAYPTIVRGSVVEEVFRVRSTFGSGNAPSLYEDLPLMLSLPTDRLEVRYLVPDDWQVQVKKTGPNTLPAPQRIPNYEGSQKTLYRIAKQDVSARRTEAYAPFAKETDPYLELQVTRIPGAGYVAADSWESLAREFSKYAFRRGGLFANPVKSATQRAVPDESVSDSLKLVQIVHWVQTNIEVGSTDKDDLTTIVAERRGNPLLISGLTQAMLDRVGIEAEFLLIHPRRSGYLDRDFISASQVPVPAVGATVDGQEYVVFPFIEDLPVTYVPPAFDGAEAMRITPDGFGGWRGLPQVDVNAYTVESRFDVTVREDGLMDVEETQTLQDVGAWFVRRSFDDLDADEREERVRELMTYDEGPVEDLRYDISGLESSGVPLTITISYTIPNLVTITPEEVLVQTGGLLSPASFSSTSVDLGERRHPIRIDVDSRSQRAITVRYPDVWTLETSLDDVDKSNQFGYVRGRYTVGSGEIRVEQQVSLEKGEAPRTAYEALLELTGSRSDLSVPTLVFKRGA